MNKRSAPITGHIFLSLCSILFVLVNLVSIPALADIVLYDESINGITSPTDSVFTVEGDWDISNCGELVFELSEAANSAKWTHISATLENENAGAAAPGFQPRGTFVITVFTEKRETTLRGPIPPSVPTFQSVITEFPGDFPAGLFSLIWHTPFWTYKDAGWGNSIKTWTLDPKKVVKLVVKNLGADAPAPVKRIIARGKPNAATQMPQFAKIPPEKFFPCIDKYGQFKWRDWPGKINSDADLAAAKNAEDADLAAHPGPKGRNKWGGWEKGPRFKATGHFYVKKINGKWWFVDPDGCLWWSHGPVRVSASCGMTPVKGREKLFEDLPEEDSPLGAFYKTRDELLWPYYVKRGVTNTYDFTSANLFRKYGNDWRNVWAERVHRRLKSWGANTIANSSDRRVMCLSRTPYCDRIEIKSRPIKGTEKVLAWWPFRDPFDPSFRADIRRQLEERKNELDDPWCFGFFVDNELCWGGETDLATWVWNSPEDQPARREFCRILKEKLGSIPETTPPQEELKSFSLAVAHAYFSGVREEFKRIAPHKLYLGCRFSGGLAEQIKRIAAQYCDVMSFNYYERDVLQFPPLPSGVDKPVIIGEFHFGALDRGPIRPGLIWLKDQYERGATYQRYLESALRNPRIVGAHWHQYADDVATGRFDGENFQIGWVDICDTPYPETVKAVRWVGENMYDIRYGSENAQEAALPAEPCAAAPLKLPRHVVFIGLDGLSGRRIAQGVEMPRMKALADAGAWTHSSRSILPSASACNWRTLFTCSPTICHGFTAWNSREPAFTPAAQNEFGRYPDIFSELRRQRPDAKIEFVYEWSGMAFVADTNACDFAAQTPDSSGPEGTTETALSRIKKGLPDFLAIVYDNPDHEGHAKGWESREFAECCSRLDGHIGRIVDAINEMGKANDTVIFITSDHGGLGRRHGNPTIPEMERPIVISGPGIAKGRRIPGYTDICDTGATLSTLLGIKMPQAWTGRPITAVFER